MNVEKVTVSRKYPGVKQYEMVEYSVTASVAEDENHLEILDKLSKELESYHRGFSKPKDVEIKPPTVEWKTNEEQVVSMEQTFEEHKEKSKDNTQRIRDVKNLIPVEMEKWIKSVYIVDDRVCVKANYLKLTDYTILAKFMDESLGAKRITDGKESRWELP